MSRSRSRRVLAVLGLFAVFAPTALAAAKSGFGEACSQSDYHLDANTWALDGDCDSTTYCNANGTCAYKGCRKDIYPFGYNGASFASLPPLCPSGQFCPDEMDQCLSQIAVGGACQKDRDDECQQPSNAKQLAGYLNTNGSICLNYQCYWANVTLGQTCVVENTVYTAFTDSGSEFESIISRDNCANGYYCDGSALQCMKTRARGSSCTGNKECNSYNCQANNTCGRAADEPLRTAPYVYALIGLGILALILGVMVTLWFTHRRSRKENQIRLETYYNEQIAYRQSIMSMSHAKNSLLSLPPNTSADLARQSLLSEDAYAHTTANDTNGLLPPNMRRDSSAAWSESADSDVLLMHGNGQTHNTQAQRKYRI